MIKEPKKATRKPANKSAATIRKPDPKKKIELGLGRHLVYMSETLFDEDLER
ncbi:hypothetical protein [Persicitalea jodogahamensis]|uniref:hypothetical protein n=1 Tax=Persicitalea jodogahamensis TaxID=402147 RepID=UPI00167B00E7|nr:hypothetical protein [Persicitalea jodogahamensis]